MAASIEKQFPVKIELIPSSGGVFEVVADKKLIYSKQATGKFPAKENILEILNKNYSSTN